MPVAHGRGGRDAIDESALGARAVVGADDVCMQWWEFADTDTKSNSERHLGRHLHNRCYGEDGLIDAKPESDAGREVDAAREQGFRECVLNVDKRTGLKETPRHATHRLARRLRHHGVGQLWASTR
jgi:hypothetical protein